MNKEEFIRKLKSYLPDDCKIDIKHSKKSLIKIQKHLFSTSIIINPIFVKSDDNIIIDIINLIKNSFKKNINLKEIQSRLSSFYEKNKQSKKLILNDKYQYKNLLLFYKISLQKAIEIFPEIDFSKIEITWGRKTKIRYRSIRFGSFNKQKNIIRIHPVLDNNNIPDFFLLSIIYHELSHFIYFELYPNSKSFHNKNFYSILKKIDNNYYDSLKWEKNNKSIFFILT